METIRKNPDEIESEAGDIPDMMDLASLWEWAGVSFGKEETFVLFLAIKRLVDEKQLKSVRLWGKVFGRDANYTVVEAELKDGTDDVDEFESEEVVADPAVTRESVATPPLQKGPVVVKPKQYSPLTKENRSGANKYIYFVCNTIGGAWTRLPDVSPVRLQESRLIRKYLTGKLDAKV